MALAILGTVKDRFDRAWSFIQDDRKVRGLDQQDSERASRLYVDPDTGVSETGVSDPKTDELWDEKNPTETP